MKSMQYAQTYSAAKALSCLCKYYGTRPDLVQAGGGNISVKCGDYFMFIKASGCTLFEVESNKNIAAVEISSIIEFNQSTDRANMSEKDFLQSVSVSNHQPSLETFFHAKTEKYTVHLHPFVVVQALNLHKNKLMNKFKDTAEFVDYYRPGLELSDHMICEKKIIFLDKHGLVVHSDYLTDVVETIEQVVDYCASLVGADISVYKEISAVQDYLSSEYGEMMYIISTDVDFTNLKKTPDCVIYSGGKCSSLEEISEEIPMCIRMNGHNFIVSKSFLRCKQIEEVLRMYSSVTTELSISDVNNLLHWDSEKYRQMEH